MTSKSAMAILAKYAPCPHSSYDDTLGNGKVWARCYDCGNEFKQENLEHRRNAAQDFQNALDVLTRDTEEETVAVDKLKCLNGHNGTEANMKWEYLVVHVENYMDEHYLNAYGDERWELAAITKTSTFARKYTFKRPKQKDAVIA